jgi:hypothetical protein
MRFASPSRDASEEVMSSPTVHATHPETAAPVDPRSFKTFSEFYPFYLGEHRNTTCRRLHFVGSSLTLVCLAMLLITGRPQYILYGLLCGYGFAWIGHFGFEKNKPASFKRPLYSFLGDWAMYRDIWRRKIPF